MDVTRDEKLLLPPAERTLFHSFSDVGVLGSPVLNCYSLVEIMAEKLRAIAGQRRFAVSRDLYDICQLARAGVSLEDVSQVAPVKFAARGVDVNAIDPAQFLIRKPEFERDWQRRLSYLVSSHNEVSFDEAWQTSVDLLKMLAEWN